MLCPTCPQVQLTMTDRNGVEIDYCPKCRGIWLDRGELDKLIDRAAVQPSTPDTARPSNRDTQPRHLRDHDDDDDDDRDDDYRSHPHPQQSGRRRKNWLSEMFDFG